MNLYQPIPMRVDKVIDETNDLSLRSFELTFENKADIKPFF